MHCLPVRRGVVVADRILDGPRSVVIHEARNRMWGRWPCCTTCWDRWPHDSTQAMSRADASLSALKHAAPYIRLFKGKVFVLKAGGEVFVDAEPTRH